MQRGRGELARAMAVVAVALAIACAWWPAIQTVADAQVDAGLKRALVSFAVAKSLNAAISVAQGTEIAVQPVGVGLTLTLGQVLDPLNDLVEQFAGLMLTAAVAFGVQKALLAMGGHWAVSLALTAAALAWAVLYLRLRAPAWLTRLLMVLLLVRFVVPVITLGSDWAFQAFLAARYQAAQQSLDAVAVGATQTVAATAEPARETGWLEWLKQRAAGLDVREKLNEVQRAVDRASDHVIDLMVVFVMQTLVVPLILLWGLIRLAGVPLASGRVPA